jgi:hypothetical protein
VGWTVRPDKLTMNRHDLGDDIAVVWTPAAWLSSDELPVDVHVVLTADDGRLAIEELTIRRRDDGAVSIDVLKSLPLAAIVATAAQAGFGGLRRVRATAKGVRIVPLSAKDFDALSELEQVALCYRAAHFLWLAPTTTVAEQLGLSRDVAAKRVQAARLAGLLEPTTKGKKGT